MENETVNDDCEIHNYDEDEDEDEDKERPAEIPIPCMACGRKSPRCRCDEQYERTAQREVDDDVEWIGK
jgi:hypothetical protein